MRSGYHRGLYVIAGMLDPKTRADEVRIIRARLGLPAGMEVKPHLEQKCSDGGIERLLGGGDDER